jgi:hypothetical protein
MQDASNRTADELSVAEDRESPVAAFVGRVLGGFLTLVVLLALVVALVALAYWSKPTQRPTRPADQVPSAFSAPATPQR